MTSKEEREKIMSDDDRLAAWKAKDRRCHYCHGARPIETITDRLFGCCKICANRDNDTVVIQSVPCIVCGDQITISCPSGDSPGITENNINTHSFANGMAGSMSYGYGCDLDGNVYMIGICRDCTLRKHARGSLILVRNYIP